MVFFAVGVLCVVRSVQQALDFFPRKSGQNGNAGDGLLLPGDSKLAIGNVDVGLLGQFSQSLMGDVIPKQDFD
jgi:hypothetical protein